MPPAPLVRLEAVGKRFVGGVVALDGVSAEVSPGEVIHVRGPNGSGKTTLLRVAAGLTRPSSGTVVRQAPATSWSPEAAVGPPVVTARHLITAVAAGHHSGRAARAAAVERAIATARHLGLDQVDEPLRALSSGGRRKVNLAAALSAPDPALLVLDEPWATLDGPTRRALSGALLERVEEGSAVLVTHHGGASPLAATRSVHLFEGRVVAEPHEAQVAVDAVRGDDRARHAVARPDSDALLTRLLADGWSIESVRRIE